MVENKILIFAVVVLFILLPTSVSGQAYFPDTTWRTSTPAEQELDIKKIDAILDQAGRNPIDSFQIIRNGYLVYEFIGDYYDVNDLHAMWSLTKSITGLAIGIALDNGEISSLNEKVLDILVVNITENIDVRKSEITIENILTMRSGISWSESGPILKGEIPAYDEYAYWGNSSVEHFRGLDYNLDDDFSNAWVNEKDWLKYMFNKPLDSDPGSKFEYNSIGGSVLSAIIEEKTSMSFEDYIKAKVFDPLGIENYVWWKGPQNYSMGGAGLWLTPFDVTKLGYLFYQNGKWEDQQLVSEGWISKMTTGFGQDVGTTYGQHIWVEEDEKIFYAFGWGGQSFYINRPNDIMIITSCSEYTENYDRSNLGCNYNFWKFLGSKAFISSETSSEKTPFSQYMAVITLIILTISRSFKRKTKRNSSH